MSKEINMAGKTLIVDDIKVLKQSKQTSTSGNVLNATREVLNKKNAGTAQSTANTAQQTANTAQSTANNAQATANTANTNAQNAQSTANTAQQTANTANTNAQNAQATANTANTNAQNAQTTANSAINIAKNGEFSLVLDPTYLTRDDTREGNQTVSITTNISLYDSPNPIIEVEDTPLICAYKSYVGVAGGPTIAQLKALYVPNYTFTNVFSGGDSWYRADSVFDTETTAIVQLKSSDGKDFSVLCDVVSRQISPDLLNLKVNSTADYMWGLDNRNISSAVLYAPYVEIGPLEVDLYNGTVLKDSAVLGIVDETPIQEYSLGVSPNNIIKNLRDTGVQVITLTANISGYDGHIINYKFNDQWIGSVFTEANSQIDDEKYYTFAVTSDQTPQTGKMYHTRTGTSGDYTYTEAVNIDSFVPTVPYYERTEVQFASGVFREELYAHIEEVNFTIPYINSFPESMAFELYNGITLMDSKKLTVIDETVYTKCIGILDSTATSFPTTTSDGKPLVDGDFLVFSQSATIGGILYSAGSVMYKLGNAWNITQPEEKTAEKLVALQTLIENNVSLTQLNNTSVIQWFSEIVAVSITAEYIGAKNIQIQSGGSIRGGAYLEDGELNPDALSRTGFHISSAGKLKATDAEFNRVTVDESSKILGTLQCGKPNDVLLLTEFEDAEPANYKAYADSSITEPDGFNWPEVNTYLNTLTGTPTTTPWNSNASTNNLCPILIENASGTVNGMSIDKLVYVSNLVTNISTFNSYNIHYDSNTPETETHFTNPLPNTLRLFISYKRGTASWQSVFKSGTEVTNFRYQITHADGTTEPEQVIYSGNNDKSNRQYNGYEDLLSGDTISCHYGALGAPSLKWNNGRTPSELTLSASLDLIQGFNLYNSGFRASMPTSGYCNLNEITGMSHLRWNDLTVDKLDLPKTTASWPTGINKYFQFWHKIGNDSYFGTKLFSKFISISSFYLYDETNTLRGTLSPQISSLTSLAVQATQYRGIEEKQIGECSFDYGAEHFSIICGAWTRGYNLELESATKNKGIYTASMFPREADTEDIGTGANKYRSIHAVNVNGTNIVGTNATIDTVNADTVNSDAIITDSLTTLITSNSSSKRVSVGASVVETYVNGTSGYRIWSDGWCEEWGLTGTSTGSSIVVLYTNIFKDTNYFLDVQARGADDDTGGYGDQQIGINGASPYDFGLGRGGFRASTKSSANGKFSWKACGYLA